VSRVAVVTGGASGVGRSIAEHLARAGDAVAVLDLDEAAASKTAGELTDGGARAIGCRVDVADRASVEDSYERVRSALGSIQIVVTSAALSGFVRFQDITPEEWQRTLDVNLTGTFHSIQAACASRDAQYAVCEYWPGVIPPGPK